MTQLSRRAVTTLLIVLMISVLAALFVQRATWNLDQHDYRNANFFDFWLAGHMVLAGQNPYDPATWLAGRHLFGSTVDPNKVFLYPLPVAFLLAPLGLLSLPSAYFTWQIFTAVMASLTVWYLLHRWFGGHQLPLFLPLVVFMMYFGPVFVSLQIGSLAPLTLLALMGALVLLDHGSPFAAGVVLAFTVLKPPQGAPIVGLAVVWFLSRRDWRAIAGLIVGGLALVALGLQRDPRWIGEFLAAGQAVLSRTLGAQSNVLSFAYLACGRNLDCTFIGGAAVVALLAILQGSYLWRHGRDLSAIEAFSLIIPAAFVMSPYLWSYDQFPFLIPIAWISGTLVARTRSYVATFGFLIILLVVSLASLVSLAYSGQELASLLTTGLVFGIGLGLIRRRRHLDANAN